MATRLLGAKLNLLSARDVLNARDKELSDGGGLLASLLWRNARLGYSGTRARPARGKQRCLLRAPQGRPALRRARPARRLVHGTPARAVTEPRVARRGRAIHATGRSGRPESQPARQVDEERGVELREGARHSAAAALRPRLHEHRLRAVHVASIRPVKRTVGAMGRPEAGVRHSSSITRVARRWWAPAKAGALRPRRGATNVTSRSHPRLRSRRALARHQGSPTTSPTHPARV